MHKLSYYTIISDPIDEKKRRLVYSTRSGSLVVLSELCYQFIHHDLIDSIPQNIRAQLIAACVLVPREENELHTVIEENHAHGQDDYGELYEVIQPSAMCQLGCYYCGQQHTKNNLSDHLIDQLVERIYAKFAAGNYTKIYIGWFGAEPLMGLPQMQTIYTKLRKKIPDAVPIGGKIVTNGLSLKEEVFRKLVQDFNIDSIEITLDGLAEYHDKHRYTKAGGASFAIIYQNIKRMLEREDFDRNKTKITIRCNVDEANVEGVESLIRKLASDDLHQKISNLYFAGIYSWGGNEAQKQALTKEQFARLKLQWEILKIKLGYPFKTSLYQRKKNTCLATGGKGEMYDAFGNIYNCTEVSYADFYQDKGYHLGNLEQDALATFTDKPHHDWFTIIQDTDQYPCHGCRLLPICGGACPKSWVEGNPACPPFKYNIVKDMQLKYLLKKTSLEELDAQLSAFENTFTAEDFERYNGA